ncbi:hypothetical protein TNCT1_38410 [Streptomyces sp. 1-11]|nr:hypothetical protein TNCT1_38410 [Streptomyces sp. 1-11]
MSGCGAIDASYLAEASAYARLVQPLSDSSNPLITAFPAELASDAVAVMAVMPDPRHQPHASFSVAVEGQQVLIPGRLYNDEPPTDAVASLSSRQRQLLHCLYSRHCDGVVRQRHLEKVIVSTDPWVVPYVVQLVSEYVLEILVVICDELRDLATPGTCGHLAYGQFIVDNPAFFARTQRRVVSYWSCYYRGTYESFRSYPGCTLLDLLRSAASDIAGHPWPNLAPAGARTDGHC